MIVMMSLIVANAIGIAGGAHGTGRARARLPAVAHHGVHPGRGDAHWLLGGAISSSIAFFWLQQVKFQIAFLGAFKVPATGLLYGPVLGMVVALAGSIGPALTRAA